MMGLLTGISVNIVCGQLGRLTGVNIRRDVASEDAVQVLVHPWRPLLRLSSNSVTRWRSG